MSPTDAMLFENWLRERDADAFKTLATRYASMVYRTCLRVLDNASEAEDVTQECFIMLANTDKPVGGYLAPWLHRVAYNRSLARLRSEHRRREREVRFASEQPAAGGMAWDEIGGYVDEAVAELPEQLRVPVVAHFLDDKTHEAIARMLGIPRSTVTYRVDQGVKALRKTLKNKGVGVTDTALTGAMRGSVAAVPASVLTNLGKLALSGSGHVATPATVAAAPLAKTVLSVWTAKTLCATAAGVAIVLFAGWEVHQAAVARDAQTQLASKPLTANAASNMPAGSPSKIMEPPIAVATAPSSGGNPEDTTSQHPPQDYVLYANAGEYRIFAEEEPGVLNWIGDRVSGSWGDLRRTLNGENRRRSSCQNNLKLLGLLFKMFANDSPESFWPMLDSRAGYLVFANENPGMKPLLPGYFEEAHIVPGEGTLEGWPGFAATTYAGDARILICPSDLSHASLLRKEGLDVFDDYSYFYLGYVVLSIEDLEAFADAYKDRIAQGLPFDADLDTPYGKLYRLREGVEQFLITGPDNDNPSASSVLQSRIPILIEAPHHHDPEGGNVLFMDGHVEFQRIGPNSEFPMDNACMDILESLSAMKGVTPPR